jgi:phytoene dehydrogenase-like protein
MEITKFKALLLKYAEGDEAEIKGIIKDLETMMRTDLPLGTPANFKEAAKLFIHGLGFLSLVKKHGSKTVEEYLRETKSSTVRQLLYRMMPPEFSALGLIMMLGTRMSGNAGYPMGGALEVTQRMVNKYKALGGKINFNARVDEIVVENGAATGIRAKGKFYPSDYLVAACDANDTLKNMLGGKYAHPQLDTLLKDAPLFDPLAIISFGLNKRLGIPFAVTYECPEDIETAPGFKSHSLSLRSFDFDEKAAPIGSSSAMVMMGAPLGYWQNLHETDPEAYKKQKQLLADNVAEVLEKRIPGFKDAIRVADVATPATYVRLTNVYKGSYEGFAPIPENMKKTICKTVPGVKHLTICGQWTTAGGGICTAVNDGKTAAHKIAKELK